jgi:hypothetical protein
MGYFPKNQLTPSSISSVTHNLSPYDFNQLAELKSLIQFENLFSNFCLHMISISLLN